MVEAVMRHCRNYFPQGEAVSGVYEIVDGVIDLSDVLKTDQYFYITGSSFSDGVHKYPCDDLTDETFQGYVTPLAPPRAFLDLCDEIEEWNEKYGAVDSDAMSPYNSESFGGYSYNKTAGNTTWQTVFASKLNDWRKI